MGKLTYRERLSRQGIDPENEIVLAVKGLIEDSQCNPADSRDVHRCAQMKKMALDSLGMLIEKDKESEGEKLSLGKLAAAVHKMESEGKSQGEILGLMVKMAESGMLPGVQVKDAKIRDIE